MVLAGFVSLLAVGGMAATNAQAAETAGPLVVVGPATSGPPGMRVDVSGRGFDEGKQVEVRWDGSGGPLVGRARGAEFSIGVVVPDVKEGAHSIVVFSRDPNGVMGGSTSAPFEVTKGGPSSENRPDAAVDAQLSGGQVGRTSGLLWVMVVGPLLALAAGLTWARRRRRRCADPASAQGA